MRSTRRRGFREWAPEVAAALVAASIVVSAPDVAGARAGARAGAQTAPQQGVQEEARAGERDTASTDWDHWGGDAHSSRYAPLEQIHAGNAGELELAWRWSAANYGPEPDYYYRATPVKAGGKLFTVAGSRRTVVALDPGTGETLWMWRMRENPRWERSPRKSYGKGVAYAEVSGRGVVFTITPGYWLVALDAETGDPLPGFGRNGMVDLQAGLGYTVHPDSGIDEEHGLITSSSPPIVVNGVVVVGNSHQHGYYPARKENIPGDLRGYDAATGEMQWRFHVIPRPGETGHETWEDGSWEYTGNVSSWAPLSADPELGIVYVPTDTPTGDYYGGHRPGQNLFGTSVLALDSRTGERVWHFQMVHHDIWNYDNPTAPTLVDLDVDGEPVRALVQVTKQGWAYVFHRETGEPVWPIEERPVPASQVPGEEAWPTQPHPTRPPAFELQGLSEEDLIDFTPELREQAVAIARQYRMGPLYTPPSLQDTTEDGKRGTFVMPGANGGANIGGGACVDPETGVLYVATERGHSVISLVPGEERPKYARFGPSGEPSNMRYVSTGPGGIRGPRGLPLLRPPYGSIVALDLNRGELMWRIPNGDTPEEIARHPSLEGIELPRTGKPTHANCLVTRSLLFFGEGRGGGPYLHAVDKRTGEAVARVELPVTTNAALISYMHEGRQYIVAPAAGPDHPAELLALALPDG